MITPRVTINFPKIASSFAGCVCWWLQWLCIRSAACRRNSFCWWGTFYGETSKHNIDIAGARGDVDIVRAIPPWSLSGQPVGFHSSWRRSRPCDPWKLTGGFPSPFAALVSHRQQAGAPFLSDPEGPDNASMWRGRATVRSDAVRISAIARSPSSTFRLRYFSPRVFFFVPDPLRRRVLPRTLTVWVRIDGKLVTLIIIGNSRLELGCIDMILKSDSIFCHFGDRWVLKFQMLESIGCLG